MERKALILLGLVPFASCISAMQGVIPGTSVEVVWMQEKEYGNCSVPIR